MTITRRKALILLGIGAGVAAAGGAVAYLASPNAPDPYQSEAFAKGESVVYILGDNCHNLKNTRTSDSAIAILKAKNISFVSLEGLEGEITDEVLAKWGRDTESISSLHQKDSEGLLWNAISSNIFIGEDGITAPILQDKNFLGYSPGGIIATNIRKAGIEVPLYGFEDFDLYRQCIEKGLLDSCKYAKETLELAVESKEWEVPLQSGISESIIANSVLLLLKVPPPYSFGR